ncbi:hypothetical protein [Idiomarina aminovorans]|uniref:hypothetical protein n=1 Tax=Idiomarina aminovorans TaxID=2914829 RepID=UPI002005EC8E|nr:hypothetical protein [Idiomarina sp. ATCH4]MCK7458487.1 hypothetical protein [Idiomarina sp. ATCH4]
MAATKRTPDQVMRDQASIAEMYLKGFRMYEIADARGLSMNQVKYDLREVRKRWRQSSVRDFDAHREEQLARLDLMEASLWREWERSCGSPEAEELEKGKKSDGPPQTGDPRYMTVMLNIIERRSKLLGLDAPTKLAPTNPDGDEPYKQIAPDEIDARIHELLAKLG